WCTSWQMAASSACGRTPSFRRRRPRWAAAEALAGLGALLQAGGRVAQEEVAHLRLGRAAQEHAEHAAGVGLERVRGAGAPAAEVLERPGAGQRLGVALLLHPPDRGGLLVGEAERGLHGLDLRVGFRLDQECALLAVALQHLHVLQRSLPFGRVVDVRRDLVTAFHRRVDLDGALTADRSHGGRAYPASRMEPDAVEIRVLGCLIEKQRTTPDVYPLTLNALRL